MKIPITLSAILFLLIINILTGCAAKVVTVNVKRPAEVDMGNVQRIAVGRFAGKGGVDIGEELTQELANYNQFQLIDRNKIEHLMKEGRLAANGLIDQKTAIELGKLIGIATYIDGRVSVYKQHEETDNFRWIDNEKRNHQSNIRIGTVTVEVAFNVVDLETGQVLLSKKISKRNTGKTSNVDRGAPSIDYAPIYQATRRDVVNEFMKSIAPYDETIDVQILTDDGIPELARGLTLIKINEWNEAVNIFKQAEAKHPENPKVLYDLGVAYKYTYQYDLAEKYLKAAYIIDQNELYKRELDHLSTMREDKGRSSTIKSAPISGSYIEVKANKDVQQNADNPLNLSWVQQKLNDLGYDCGETDGMMGAKTQTCIRAFQLASGLNVTGALDNSTVRAMLEYQ